MPENGFDENESLLGDKAALPPGAFDVPAAAAEFRAELFERTRGVVRARPRRRKAMISFGAVLAYAAGLATMVLVPRETPSAPGEHIVPVQVVQSVTGQPLTPQDLLAQNAGATPAQQAAILETAGDLYLTEWDDVQSALDCYKQALQRAAGPGKLSVKSSDSWLLASLKMAQITEAASYYPAAGKETNHENSNS